MRREWGFFPRVSLTNTVRLFTMGEDVRETPGSSEEGRKRSALWNKRKVRRKREVIMFEKIEKSW